MSKIAIVGATGNYGGKAIESLLQHGINPNEIVAIYRKEEITAPKTYSYQDLANILTEVSGKKVEYVETTIEAYGIYLAEIGIPKEFQMWDSGMMQPFLFLLILIRQLLSYLGDIRRLSF